jgi:hypothetical protein
LAFIFPKSESNSDEMNAVASEKKPGGVTDGERERERERERWPGSASVDAA